MVSSYDIERRVVVKLMREYRNSIEVLNICRKFNYHYKDKHDNNYLTKTNGEVLITLKEEYNLKKAKIFERYIERYYL
jgi:hypothetical protein